MKIRLMILLVVLSLFLFVACNTTNMEEDNKNSVDKKDLARLLPSSTTFPAPISNTGLAKIDHMSSSIEIPMINNMGAPISFPMTGKIDTTKGYCTFSEIIIKYDGRKIPSEIEIPPGEEFNMIFVCNEDNPKETLFRGTLTFDYVNTQTTMKRSHIGTIQGEFE